MEGDPPLETKHGSSNENCENCLWVLVREALEVCGYDSPGRLRGEAEMALGRRRWADSWCEVCVWDWPKYPQATSSRLYVIM